MTIVLYPVSSSLQLSLTPSCCSSFCSFLANEPRLASLLCSLIRKSNNRRAGQDRAGQSRRIHAYISKLKINLCAAPKAFGQAKRAETPRCVCIGPFRMQIQLKLPKSAVVGARPSSTQYQILHSLDWTHWR